MKDTMFSFSNLVALQDLSSLKPTFSIIPIPILVVNDQFHIVFKNIKAADIFEGDSRPSVFDFVNVDDRMAVRQAFEHTLSKKEWHSEFVFSLADHPSRIFDTQWILLSDGVVPCAALFFTEITEKKKLQEQMLRSQRMESLGLLMSGITHDLNNILSTVMVGSRLLMGKVEDEQSKVAVQLMERGAKRGGGLVRHLLSFVKGMDHANEVFSLEPLIMELRELVMQITPSTIEFKVDISATVWPIYANAVQVHQVIMNLCLNAKDAMEEVGGTLLVSVYNQEISKANQRHYPELPLGSYVCIQVRDTGPGIPSEIVDRMFEPFFTTKSSRGTGLGLSTVMTIVRKHGGSIKVSSAIGEGTQFFVLIPAAAV
jgi:two-component system cell cycle sensor histidine kinase/response regulator CckA